MLHEHQTETIAGSYAAMALLLASAHGRPGQLIELTKHECFSICAAGEVVKWTYAGLSPTRLGSALFQPMEVMSASDGDLFVLCTSEEQWQRLMREMGDPEWASWEIFAHRGLRGENWDVLEPRLAPWFATRSCDELMDLALRERLPFAFALAPPGVEEYRGGAVRQWRRARLALPLDALPGVRTHRRRDAGQRPTSRGRSRASRCSTSARSGPRRSAPRSSRTSGRA